MRIGRSYKQHPIQGPYDVIVVGSGVGGLACAALLAKHGQKKVLVLERHYTAGGYTHVFHRTGYEWDVGVHYVGQMHPRSVLRKAFDEVTDGQLQWADMGEVYDTIVIGDDRYAFVAGREEWRAQMHSYFPRETQAIDRYLDLVKAATRSAKGYFLEKALPRPLSAVVGKLMRRSTLRFASRTTRDVLSELTSNRRLIAVLCGQYGDYGLPPSQSSFFMHATVANHYFGGGAYPVGGSSRIAETILPLIEREGGAVMTSAEVDEVLIAKGRAFGVRLTDGTEITAPVVISNAGAFNTLQRLLPADTRARQNLDRPLNHVTPSVAHASLYLGFKQTADQLGLSRSNVWRYAHDDHDRAVAEFIDDPTRPLPVAYLSFPSAKDPDFERRHPGRATVEVVTLAPFERFARFEARQWKARGTDYDDVKAELTERLLAELYAEHPHLGPALEHIELSTPLSTARFTGFQRGEIYGLAHTPARFAQSWLRPRTPISGLYLTGADVVSAGVGGALFGGVLTASTILRRNLLGVIVKRRPTEDPPALGNLRWA